jgi:hypothetical protein
MFYRENLGFSFVKKKLRKNNLEKDRVDYKNLR